ncbi:MAG: hypothetical protein KJ964_04220 [Verrucomicrobia bacterium]|nr:hypothetical protein [Verrucomicrobiota bacterium]MBU1734673.1 hypothetical protein [Verrucomicrobiota bacterium]MBU1856125.1 hypothetical protein [Verrucomicrobiota bacterium]
MKLSSREAGLGITTGALLLFGLTFLVGTPKIRVWQERIETRKVQAQRIEVSKRLVGDRARWDKRLAGLHARLSRYPAAMDVTADYLKILGRVAKDNNITLVQIKPQKEKRQGDCYEMPVDCTWEGDLNGLVHFLYALEQENVTMDMEDLSVSLVAGGKERLKGNFTLMCIYTREGTGLPVSETNAPTQSKPGLPLAISPDM